MSFMTIHVLSLVGVCGAVQSVPSSLYDTDDAKKHVLSESKKVLQLIEGLFNILSIIAIIFLSFI